MDDTHLDNDGDCREPDQDGFEDAVMDTEQQSRHVVQYKALEAAWAAAEAGDPVGMLTAIHESRFSDGLFRVLRSMDRFDQLPDSEIELAIAEGIDQFYTKVRDGHKILNLPAYLWKAVQYIALGKLKKAPVKIVLTDPADLDAAVSDTGAAATPQAGEEEPSETQIDPDHRRKAALQFANKMLPRLGQDNVQKVMRSLFAAVERGEFHWPPSAISAETGLKPNTVSVLLARGFERLSREAAKEGLQSAAIARQFIENSDKN